jgi:hypothetical protein
MAVAEAPGIILAVYRAAAVSESIGVGPRNATERGRERALNQGGV